MLKVTAFEHSPTQCLLTTYEKVQKGNNDEGERRGKGEVINCMTEQEAFHSKLDKTNFCAQIQVAMVFTRLLYTL